MPGDRDVNIAGRDVQREEPQANAMPSEASLKAMRKRGANGDHEPKHEANDGDTAAPDDSEPE
jgi:hypothetical protein